MNTKAKLSKAEAGRLGALATNRRHSGKKPTWGRKGYETRVQRYWNGDYRAHGLWLSAKGLAATDPAPWNGAFPDPGPEPIPIEDLLDRDFIALTR